MIKKKLVEEKLGYVYFEPEKECISRGGEICVVAQCDQWYISYGLEEQKEKLKEFVLSNKFNTFNETLKKCYENALDWLNEWGCSRSFGLGTLLPWDK